jgi:integrase
LHSKGNRIRTVPIPSWAKHAVDEWAKVADLLFTGRIFRSINRHGKIDGGSMTPRLSTT